MPSALKAGSLTVILLALATIFFDQFGYAVLAPDLVRMIGRGHQMLSQSYSQNERY